MAEYFEEIFPYCPDCPNGAKLPDHLKKTLFIDI